MATPTDAELILKLYELRTEATMRESRHVLAGFSPQSVDEILTVVRGMGTRENAAWRQVISYWEMAAALVLHGTLDAELFLDTNGENFFYYARMTPFFEEFSKATGQPFMPRLTKLIETHPAYQDRYTMVLARMGAAKKQGAA